MMTASLFFHQCDVITSHDLSRDCHKMIHSSQILFNCTCSQNNIMIIRIITVQLPRYLTIDRRDINHGQSLACIYNDVTVMYNIIIIVLYDNLDRAVYNVYNII